MPLLTSPIDGSPMKQIERFGVEIDICPTSGGVWLDRGELEKIIQMIQEAANQNGSVSSSGGGQQQQMRSNNYDNRQRREERESPLEMIMDLFDFG